MKIDLKKDRRDLYQPSSAEFVEIDVPPMTYLAIDGRGDPNTEQRYVDAVQALYSAAYTLKFAAKARGLDFVVGPLEGLWRADDPAAFTQRRKGEWAWTMLIAVPDQVDAAEIDGALAAAAAKKPELPIGEVRAEVIVEGRSLQIMHVGSYDDEGPTLSRLHEQVMPALGVTFNGPHHEIYLGDPRRVAPERLKTVLRQPVRPVA